MVTAELTRIELAPLYGEVAAAYRVDVEGRLVGGVWRVREVVRSGPLGSRAWEGWWWRWGGLVAHRAGWLTVDPGGRERSRAAAVRLLLASPLA